MKDGDRVTDHLKAFNALLNQLKAIGDEQKGQ
jgi:hypothetical protein